MAAVIPRNGQPPDPSPVTVIVVMVAVFVLAADSLRRISRAQAAFFPGRR